MRRTNSSMLRIAGIAALVSALLSACVGIPVARQTLNHILATAWTPGNQLVVVAQRVRVGQTAWLGSPEGPGIHGFYDCRELLLMDETESVTHEIHLLDPGEQVVRVFALHNAEEFIVITWAVGKHGCYIVRSDGTISRCASPTGQTIEPSHTYFSQVSSELVSGLISGDVTINIRTGLVRPLEDPFRRLGLPPFLEAERQQMHPCPIDEARLSPQEDAWAVGCTRSEGLGTVTTMWVVARDSPARIVYEFPPLTRDELVTRSYVEYRDRKWWDDLMLTRSNKQGCMAWSPDQGAIYFCCPPQDKGVVAYLDGRPPIEGTPCLTSASWSLDGTRLAGVTNRAVVTWEVNQHAF